jgi:UDP-glucose 6-dehydrogenase
VTKAAKKKQPPTAEEKLQKLLQQKAAKGLVVTLDQMEKLMRSVLDTEAVR